MYKRVTRLVRRASQFSGVEWRYLTIALKELFLAWIRHGARPMIASLREFETQNSGHTDVALATEGELEDIQRRAWAIAVVSARVPWRSDCLLQAMAANRWLLRDQLCPEFFIGVEKDDAGELRAHAWLRLRGIDVTGGGEKEYSAFELRAG